MKSRTGKMQSGTEIRKNGKSEAKKMKKHLLLVAQSTSHRCKRYVGFEFSVSMGLLRPKTRNGVIFLNARLSLISLLRAGCLPRCVRTDGRVEVCVRNRFRHWSNRALSRSGCSKSSTHTRRSASGADNNRMANLACHRPRSTM